MKGKKKMLEWYVRNQKDISMFIAGWCALATIDCLLSGNDLFAVINGFLVWFNIKMAK
jgi:hypothetical protein